jgi:hypothetical protein
MTKYETHDCELKNEASCEEEIEEDGSDYELEGEE